MKNHEISSSRRKNRKAHFSAPSHIRRRLLSAHLSKDLRSKHPRVRSLPIRKDDEVTVVRGTHKGLKGKIIQSYRRRWYIHIEKLSKTKANGAPYHVPINPSNCVLTKLKLGRDREDLIKRKSAGSGKGKGEKYTGKDVGMKSVD
eukprot:TRINITY_DN262_c0_g1_i1.p1 TRINITY_DN262_c0_g1~~TRINITY_DN262_c0_g1_i1.p1  ORF type:complete len:145 (+),score=47.76 TRINITY_DN262_c0_g1_i1:129-563(+)